MARVKTASFLSAELHPMVRATVEATIPAMYAGLVFQNYHIAHQGGRLWEVTVRYGKREPKQPGESSFSFDTGGGTTHITQSLQTVAKYPGDAPDFKGPSASTMIRSKAPTSPSRSTTSRRRTTSPSPW